MRILFVSTSTGLGGAEKCMLRLACGLKEKGHEVKVISLTEKGAVADELQNAGIEVSCIKTGKFPRNKNLNAVEKEILAFKPDVVHAFLYRAIQVCRFIKNKQFKLVSSPHTNYQNRNFLLLHLDKILKDYDDISLAESYSTKEFLLEKQKYNEKKTELLLNYIENNFKEDSAAKKTLREKYGSADKTVFLTVGRLSKEKGQKYLIEAFAKVKERNPQTALWIAGGGKKEDFLKRLAVKKGIEKDVVFFGPVQNTAELLNAADIFVLPSLSESMPLVLLEAYNAALPAIVTNTGDNGVIYKHGETGFVCAVKDSVILGCLMETLLDGKLREKFKQNIKQNPLPPRDYAREHLRIYNKVIGE